MRVIKRLPLQQFGAKHPAAAQPLADWHTITRKATWRTFADVRRTFRATDVAKVASKNTVAVFDIGGDKYRLIAKRHGGASSAS